MTIRVLHIITRLELGGAQRNTLFTVANLDRASFAPALAWGPGDRLDNEADVLTDVDLFPVPSLVRPLSPGRDVAALLGLRKAIRSFRPDVVHTHSSKAGILGRFAAGLENVPVVVHTIHGWGFTPLQSPVRRSIYVLAERMAARWTTHFVAVSHANRRQGIERNIVAPEHSSVIRSGIDLSLFENLPLKSEARRELGLPPEHPVVTQVSNFKPQKAPLDCVRAAALIAQRIPQAHFVMAGDGPLRDDVRALGKKLGLGDRLLLPGWQRNIPLLYAATDVAVLSSRHEGLPRAVVEALASGVPVVATEVDGTPEVLSNGENGYLVPPGDVELLADRVCLVLADEECRTRMSAAASRGLEEFDINTMVRQQEELYTCLICRTS